MARTLLHLARRMKTVEKKVAKSASNLAVKVANAIVTDLAINTPVDTSQAVSNWNVSFDVPIQQLNFPHYPGKKGSTETASIAQTIRIAKNTLRKKIPGQTIYIVNNTPYIKWIDKGSFRKNTHIPGRHFIERALVAAHSILRNG